MRNPDILKQTNFQSRIIPIDFAGYPERTMLAGSPVNAKGQFANDGSAIGILVEDVRRDYAYGEIAVAGFVDYEIAQNHAGIEYTKECMTALKNIVFEGVGDKWIESGGGVTSWNDLTDKPFREEKQLYETIADNVAITLKQISETAVGSALAGSMFQSKLGSDFGATSTMPFVANGDYSEWNVEYVLTVNGYDMKMTKTQGWSNSVSAFYGDNGDVEIRVNNNGNLKVENLNFSGDEWVVSMRIYVYRTSTLDPKFLPKASAIEDVTATPTAEDFNSLLAVLRAAGYMAE